MSAQAYCSLPNWLQKNESKLYSALESLCAVQMLTARTPNGITFVVPDAASQKKIMSAKTSAEQLEAVKLFGSHIFYQAMPKAADFMNARERLRNAAQGMAKFVKTAGDNVELEGVTIAPVKFEGRSDRFPMAIWAVKKGTMPRGTPAPPLNADRKVAAAPVKGGARTEYKSRRQFAEFIERQYIKYMSTPNCKNDPYLCSLLGFLTWLSFRRDTYPEQYEGIVSMLSPNWRAEFYIVFQPFSSGPYLVPDDVFGAWQSEVCGYCLFKDPVGKYLQLLENVGKDIGNKAEIACKAVKEEIRQTASARATITEAMIAAYSKLSRAEAEYAGVLPPYAANYLQANPNAKAHMDQGRFLLRELFKAVDARPDIPSKVGLFNELKESARLELNMNVSAPPLVFNQDAMSSTAAWYSVCYVFFHTDDFLYIGGKLPSAAQCTLPDDPKETDEICTIGDDLYHAKQMQPQCVDEYRLSSLETAIAVAKAFGEKTD